MTELMDMIHTNRKNLQAKDDERRKQAKWDRYMRCDGSPDPTIQGEINTYINLELENKDRDDAESVLKDSQQHLALIAELDFLLADTPLEDLPNQERQRYRETIGELQHLIQTKLGVASLQVLCDASKLQDPETSNLQFTLKNDNVSLCMWGNLSKNPRIKSFEFGEAGFIFDIPKTLTLSSCAIRYMHTKFDHFSSYSKAFYPRRKRREEEVVVAPVEEKPAEEEQPAEGEGGEGEGGEKPEGEESVEEKEDTMTPEPTEWEDFDEEDDVVDLRAYQVVGGVFCFDLLGLPPQPKVCKNWVITQLVDPPELEFLDYVADAPVTSGQEKGKEKEHDKRDEKPPINVTVNLPSDVMFLEEPQVARWDPVKQYWRTDGFSNFAYDEDNRTFKFSVRQFGTLSLLQDTHINMPFQSWELRPHGVNAAVLTIIAAIVELEIEIKDGLCCLSQPADKPELAHILNQWMTPRELVENAPPEVAPSDSIPEDPSTLVGSEVASMNAERSSKQSDRSSVLHTDPPSATSLVRPSGMEPSPSMAMDSKKSKRSSAKKGNKKSRSAGSSKGRFGTPGPIEELPEVEEHKAPHPIVVERMYEQMALVASSMAFSWSKWNSAVDYENVVLQGAEALSDEPLLEEDWGMFLVSKRRFAKLKMSEFDEEFSQEMETDVSFRSNLYHFLQGTGSEAAKERVQETSIEFVDCVHQLLKATQVLTYA
ncbi:hypothetical protein BaRGS_00030157 [Batillaria attramentaria]|uniref:IC97/Casc1 N-terminal domain-containing protein n=1 Tax=Batillaria attramentaria TaxID=370345 RepID=A0ABD0JU61_9CAEN